MKGILILFALLVILPMTASAETGEKAEYVTTNPATSFTYERSAAKLMKGDVCKTNLNRCHDDLACLFQVSVAQKHCRTH